MNAPKGFAAMPGARFLRGDVDPDVRAENECRVIGGTHFCAAGSVSLGHVGEQAENATGIGLLLLTNRGGGARPIGRADQQGHARAGWRTDRNGQHGRRQRSARRRCCDRPRKGSR